MGVTAMEMRVYMQKALIITMKTSYRSACEHPFVVGMLFFFIFLYRFLPSLFYLLVSSSPVIICTAVLLGTLLSFGSPYIPEIDEEDDKISETHHSISSLRSGVVENELVVEKDGSFSIEGFVNNSRELKEKDLIFSENEDDGSGSASDNSTDGDGDEKTDKEILDLERRISEHEEKKRLIDGEDDVGVQYSDFRVEIGNEEVGKFGSVKYSSISRSIDDNEESSEYDSDSDRAESSSPDASLAEIMPMLDELHPLLDSEPFQPPVVSMEDDEDVALEESASSDESEEDEAEHVEVEDDEDDEDEDEDKQRGKDGGGAEAVVTWTKEDEKNLMDLGNSELERNRRLESLIARRRSRKNFRVMMAEKNLIDLDGTDPPFQISPISTARRNPFDLHYDSNEGMDLPPIPGSAPSVMAKRRNPFDIPYDHNEEKPNLAGGSFEEEFFSSHEKDMFRRYESFNVGSSFSREPTKEKPASKFRPVFVPEQLHSEEIGYRTFQRQISEISESKMSSVTEMESASSASDQDVHKSESEQESIQPGSHVEQELSQPMPDVEHATDHVKPESSSSGEAAFIEIDQEEHRDDIADEGSAHESEFTSAEIGSVASPTGSDTTHVYMKPEVVQEKHNELSSSSSSELTARGGLENPVPKTDDATANNSTQPSIEDFNNGNGVEGVDNITKEPVYDWSWTPSEMEKSLSGITIIEEALNYVDTTNLTSTSSAISDMPVEAESGSTPLQVDQTISSTCEESLLLHRSVEEGVPSGNEGLSASSSHFDTIEKNEVSSREVTMISEHADNQNIDDVTAPMVPSVSEQVVVYHSDSSSSGTDFENKSSVTDEGNVQIEQNQTPALSSDPHPAHADVPEFNLDGTGPDTPGVSSEDSTHIMSEMAGSLPKEPMTYSLGVDREESQEPSSPMAVSVNGGDSVDDSWEVVHEDRGKDSSNHSAVDSSPDFQSGTSENEPTARDINSVADLLDETQNNRYSEDLEHSNFSQVETAIEVNDREFDGVHGITEIDERLLTELDVVGDFKVEESGTKTNLKENLLVGEDQENFSGPPILEDNSNRTQESEQMVDLQESFTGIHVLDDDSNRTQESAEVDEFQESLTGPHVHEEHSHITQESVGADIGMQDPEKDSYITQESVEAVIDMQDHEEASSAEDYWTPKHLLTKEIEDQLKTNESWDVLGRSSAKALVLPREVKLNSEEMGPARAGTSVEEENSEAAAPSNTEDSKRKTQMEAVGLVSVEPSETNQTASIIMELAGEVKSDSEDSEELMTAKAGISVKELAGEVKSDSEDSEELMTAKAGTSVKELAGEVKSDSEELMTAKAGTSVKELAGEFKSDSEDSEELMTAKAGTSVKGLAGEFTSDSEDSEELMTAKAGTSVKEKNFEAEEASETSNSSNADENKRKAEVDAVDQISTETSETNTSETDSFELMTAREYESNFEELLAEKTRTIVKEKNSEAEETCETSSTINARRTQVSMHKEPKLEDVKAGDRLKSNDPVTESAKLSEVLELVVDVLSNSQDQLEPTDMVDHSGEIPVVVDESSAGAKSSSEEILADETKLEVKESSPEVEKIHEASSTSVAVLKNKEKKSGKSRSRSRSSSGSSSSSSSSDSE